MSDPDQIITIRSIRYSGDRDWLVQVTTVSSRVPSCDTHDLTLLDPFNSVQEANLLWALETHPANEPFQTHRARSISCSLREYANDMLKQLGLSAPGPGKSIRVDVEGDREFQSLHWEVLELFSGIVVRRKVRCNDIRTHSSIISIAAMTFRILVVVSHSVPAVMKSGHTNPRMVSRSIVDLAAEINSKWEKSGQGVGIHVEIVRPGSWKALKQHLEMQGKRYFHLIHFDVHARCEKKDIPSIAFSPEDSTRKRSWHTASEISALLSEYNVKIVVLNAPRTAIASRVCDANMAELLVKDGIRAVVAFPYKVLNAGSSLMMTKFYHTLLSSEIWDLALALSTARKAMMDMQLRDGKFGVKVPVDDWIIPVLYHNGGTEVSVIGSDLDEELPVAARTGKLRQKVGGLLRSAGSLRERSEEHGRVRGRGRGRARGRTLKVGDISVAFLTRGEMVGRDCDIYDIETRFLTQSNILRITGAPAVGKSTFTVHLCRWWKSTSFVRDYFSFCFYQKPHLNVDMICRQIYLSLFPLADQRAPHNDASQNGATVDYEIFPSGWMEQTITKLRDAPYLIVLDSLELSDASVEGIERLMMEFNVFLGRLAGGRSLILIVSNQQESWVDDKGLKVGTYLLKPLKSPHAIELATSILQRENGNMTRFEGADDKNYFGKLLNLMDRNPLAIELTFPNFAQGDESIRTVFFHFLQGSTPLGATGAASIHAIKSLKIIADLVHQLDTESKMVLYCLAPFWSIMPKNLDTYFIRLLSHNVLPPGDCARSSVIVDFLGPMVFEIPSEERIRLQQEKKARLELENLKATGLLDRYQDIVSELLCLEFLYENPPQIDNDCGQREQYYGVHPLLTLFLRQLVVKDEECGELELVEYSSVKRAFVEYYDLKSQLWNKSSEEEAARDLKVEETNFLSAISIAIQDKNIERCFNMFPTQAFVRLAAMSLIDVKGSSIASLIALFCEEVIKKADLLGARKAGRKPNDSLVIVTLFAANWLTEYHAEKSGPAAFKSSAEKALSLMLVVEKTSPWCIKLLTILEEQACKQKALAATEGMVRGLKVRMPFSGLIRSEVAAGKSVASSKGRIWIRLARTFLKMRSIAVQAQMMSVLKNSIRCQLQKDMIMFWQNCIKTLRSTALEPLTRYFDWVPNMLVSTSENTTLKPVPASRFVAYPEFVRSQLNLQLHNPESAKMHLLTGLERAQKKNNVANEYLCHLLLSELTYLSRSYEECISHVQSIYDIQDSLPSFEWSRDDHLAYADITLRKALCHRNLSQWDEAIVNLSVAGEIASLCEHYVLVYVVLRKLASIKRDTGKGEQTVAQLLLQAIGMAYDKNRMEDSAVGEERGVLLRGIFITLQVGKAQEEREDVIARIATRSKTDVGEVRLFLNDVVDVERVMLRNGALKKMSKTDMEKDIAALWKDAEIVVFGTGKEKNKALARWEGTKWEKGVCVAM